MCAVCFTSAQLVPVGAVLARAVWVSRRAPADDDEPGDDDA